MTGIIFALGILNFFIYFKNWKKLFYLFIFFIPYLGYIQHQIQPYIAFAPLIHDFIFIIPLYLIIIFTQKNLFFLPKNFGHLLLSFAILLLLQMFNPFNSLPFIARLVGLKVWFFYFFFIIIGYKLIDEKKDLKKFCNVFAIITIIPCLIGNLQYILSQIIGYQEVMISFYNSKNMAFSATQGFTQFQLGVIKLVRIPSTFSFVGQYLNFLMIALIPALTSIALSNTEKEKKFYQFIFFFLIVSILLTGARGAIIFLIIFYVFFKSQDINPHASKGTTLLKFLILFIVSILLYEYSTIFKEIFSLGKNYTFNYFFVDFTENIVEYFFGLGIGNATNGLRYLGIEKFSIHEGYYWKSITELGFFGLVFIILLFFNYLKQAKLSMINLFKHKEKIFCSSFYGYTCYLMISNLKTWVNFDGFPTNFLFFLTLGIIFKLGSKEYIAKSYL